MPNLNQLKINNEWLPYCDATENFDNIEEIKQNEAGEDVIVSITRLQKRSWSCSAKADPVWVSKIIAWGKLPLVSCQYNSDTFSARLRVSKVKHPRYLEDTGVAEVTFSLIEV